MFMCGASAREKCCALVNVTRRSTQAVPGCDGSFDTKWVDGGPGNRLMKQGNCWDMAEIGFVFGQGNRSCVSTGEEGNGSAAIKLKTKRMWPLRVGVERLGLPEGSREDRGEANEERQVVWSSCIV